jgi:YD repeat-containing protein
MRPDDGEPRISTRGRRDIMVADATAVRTELTRDEAGRLLGQTMALMAVTAGAFALDAYLGRNLAYQWGWLFFIGSHVSRRRERHGEAIRAVGDHGAVRVRRADGLGGGADAGTLICRNEVDKGGHFAAWEEPQLFSEEIRAAFRSLR